MKKVMILGAGRGQMGLIRAAKRLGYKSVVASIDGDYPGFKEADEICIADIKDREAISKAARDHAVDGIVTACMDAGLFALGAACDNNGLVGISEKVAEVSANKYLMKEAFQKYGVSAARHMLVSSMEELIQAADILTMPVIIKAVDLGGSRGINIVHSVDELEAAYQDTMEATTKDYCIVEEYIDGYECSATAMVADGKIVFVLPKGDIRYGKDDEVPIGHYVPFECDDDIREQIEEQVSLAIKAIGLDNCAVNADIMIRDGKVYILELTGRLGANCIPELTSLYYGFDIHEMIIETSLGNFDMANAFDKTQCIELPCRGEMIISEKSGILDGIEYMGEKSDKIKQIWFFKESGNAVNKFTCTKDCIGQVVVVGDSNEECVEEMKQVMKDISLSYK